jgi:hypothetical protein
LYRKLVIEFPERVLWVMNLAQYADICQTVSSSYSYSLRLQDVPWPHLFQKDEVIVNILSRVNVDYKRDKS